MTNLVGSVTPNLKDDVEDIVNSHSAKNQDCRERIVRERKARRIKRLCFQAGAAGMAAIVTVLLGCVGIVADAAAVIAGVVLACQGCYLFGRYREAR